MEMKTVYLGSDHVIQRPRFGIREKKLSVFTDSAAGRKQATKTSAAGVLNSYQIDLDTLTVKYENQETLDGFDRFDIIMAEDNRLTLCTSRALDAMQFMGAHFVSR